MRKVLIHAGMSPLEQPSLDRVFEQQLFTTNSGNLLFQYGTYRTLMTGDTEFVTRFLDRKDVDDAFIERANQECACVVLPMANNFRESYSLRALTRLVKKLRIPCVVVGIGLQARDPSLIGQGFPFDEGAKAFVRAVLDHSAMIGVRGEMTADYLASLGFVPERHFTVIGCPSMYSRGSRLPEVRQTKLSADSRVCFNYRIDQPIELAELLNRGMRAFPDYRIVVQRREEMFMIRYHRSLIYSYQGANRCAHLYPHDYSHPALKAGRIAGFASAAAWLEHMRGMDYNMGSRIHGNIAAVLAGTPTLALTLDTRMEELCRYHNIPHIPASQLNTGVDPARLLEGVDYSEIHRGHDARFRHFLDFLNANGLAHIYSNGDSPAEAPLDRALAALPKWGEIAPETDVPLSTLLEGFRQQKLWQLHNGLRVLAMKARGK